MRVNIWKGMFVVLVLLTGCATNSIDWTTRVGSYSYEQALVDLGPPDRSQNLADGTVIAKWQTIRHLGLGAGGSNAGSPGLTSPLQDQVRIRELVFGPDGMLLMVAR